MQEIFKRTQMLIGKENIDKLANSSILLFGVGGVGGYAAEMLARCSVGSITLVDNDCVSKSNINRQIIATLDTVGRLKTEVMKERILSVNPKAQVDIYNCFFLPENSNEIDFTKYDYIIDAVDTVTAKIEIITKAQKESIPVISCMGTGNKLDPTRLKIDDIYKTSICPLARIMRSQLRKRGVESLKVLYSTEQPIKPDSDEKTSSGKPVPGSVSFVPSVAGILIAREVIIDIMNKPVIP